MTVDILKTRPKQQQIIALEDRDFSWTQSEVEQAIRMWEQGASIKEMVYKLRKPVEALQDHYSEREVEVVVLIMDLALKGLIKSREGGVFGGGY